MTSPFPHGFDPTSSILFVGAGFSSSATNVGGSSPPAVSLLEAEIKKLADLPDDDPSSLQDVASYAVSNNKDLYNLLNDLYCIKELHPDQSEILNQPWLRIYTTNYDDIVEKHWLTTGKHLKSQSFSLEDSTPNQLRPGAIIHLHGYIHRCNKSDILKQLVLSHYSYAQQRALGSPWWEIFSRDVRVAQNIFFVGYELNDFEPASYLTKNPASTKKTHFILRPAKSPVAENRLKEYGSRYSIAVAGFAKECRSVIIKEKPEHANALSAFRYVDLLKDNKIAIQPSPIEIQSLFTFGKFQFPRLLATFPKDKYTISRSQHLTSSLKKLDQCKFLILHSKVGNGKTVFRHGLSVILSQAGHSCFEVRENVDLPAVEIEFLRRQEKAVVIFPNYDTAYTNIHLFSDMRPDARFIVEMSTSTLQVRQSEVFDRFDKPIERVDLNRLSAHDCQALHQLLDEAGIAPPDFERKFKDGVEFRDIILSVFENPVIIDRIDRIVLPLIGNSEAKLVLLCSSILKSLGLNTDPEFIRSISRVDSYEVLLKSGEAAYEFLDFAHDRVEPHSALFSEFLIKRYLKPHELAGAVFRMAAEAARRMNEEPGFQSERARTARAALGSLLRFSFLNDMLKLHPDRSKHIRDIYENGRQHTYIQGEPLFWLQYSILMQDIGRWDIAERHLETAYQRGAARPEFLTYQLDTNFLGLCIELELRNSGDAPVERAPKIVELLEKARSMIAEGNHRGHALKVLNKLEPFAQKRKTGLSQAEVVSLIYNIKLLVAELNELSVDDKAVWGSETVKKSLSRAAAFLLS